MAAAAAADGRCRHRSLHRRHLRRRCRLRCRLRCGRRRRSVVYRYNRLLDSPTAAD